MLIASFYITSGGDASAEFASKPTLKALPFLHRFLIHQPELGRLSSRKGQGIGICAQPSGETAHPDLHFQAIAAQPLPGGYKNSAARQTGTGNAFHILSPGAEHSRSGMPQP
jgi:hypothetical protein